jgi:dihydrofolate reductase
MSRVFADISVSLDGYVAGPNPTLDQPLGDRGEELHEWAVATESWREAHRRSGGETGADSEVIDEAQDAGATVMGRRMFSGGQGPWDADPNPNGWWGDEPPFRRPVFVLTHHEREPLVLGETTFTFVTEGAESALERARDAAGDEDIAVAGGASAIQQYLASGALDELQIHLVPILLGGGVRLFEALDPGRVALAPTRVIDSPAVTHISYRVNAEPQERS